MLQDVMIIGAKSSKGEMDNRPYDSTKLYIEVRLDPTKGTMVGACTEQYDWGLSSNFDLIKDMKFPLRAKVDFLTVSNGKSSKTIVMDVEPQSPTQIQAKA